MDAPFVFRCVEPAVAGTSSTSQTTQTIPPEYGLALGGSIDGDRFLVTKPSDDETDSLLRVQVILNWFGELE